jgi:uncharacterized Tic20 family protein
VCAILHASSHYSIFAIAASVIVWTTQRTRSRFVALQALQATLFQLTAFVAVLLASGLYAAGMFVAVFSAFIVPPGVDDPGLAYLFVGAVALGFGSILLFQWIFPFWGVWAAVRILRGRNFRYPILGRLAVTWTARQPIEIEAHPMDQGSTIEAADGETLLAGLGHLSVIGGLGLILAPVLWATAKRRSRFLTDHLLQTALFHLFMAGTIFALYLCFAGFFALSILSSRFVPVTIFSPFFPFGGMAIIGILLLVRVVLALVAAVRAFKGKVFRYPIVGWWLARYLGRG